MGSLRHTQDSKRAFAWLRRRGRLGSLAGTLRHTQDGKRAFAWLRRQGRLGSLAGSLRRAQDGRRAVAWLSRLGRQARLQAVYVVPRTGEQSSKVLLIPALRTFR